jgi:hypothetical protein
VNRENAWVNGKFYRNEIAVKAREHRVVVKDDEIRSFSCQSNVFNSKADRVRG